MSDLQRLVDEHLEKYGKLFLDDPEERPKYLQPADEEDVRFMLKCLHETPAYANYVAGLFWDLAREGLLHAPVLSAGSNTKSLFFKVLNLRDSHVRRYLIDGVLRAETVWRKDARTLFNALKRHWEDASRILEHLLEEKDAQTDDLLKEVLLHCFDYAAKSGDSLTQGRLTWILFNALFENEELCMYFFKSIANSIARGNGSRTAYLSTLLLIEYDGWIHREKHWVNKFSAFFSGRSDEDPQSLQVIFRSALETSEYGNFIGEHWQWQSIYKSPLFCAIGELLAKRGMAPLDLILSQNPHGFEDHLLDLLLLLLNASPEMEKELQKIVRYADNDGNSAWSMLDILVYRASKNEDHEYPEIRSLLERAIPEKIRKDTQRREQTEKEQGAYAETQLEEKQKHIQAMAKVSEGETGHYVWGLLSEYRTDPSIFNDRAKLAVKREIEKLLAWKLFDLSREQYPEEGQWLSAISPFCKTLEILRDDTKGFFWIQPADVRDVAVRALPFAFDESQRDLLLESVGALTPEDVEIVLRPGLLDWKHWIYLWNLLALFRSRTDEFLQRESEVFDVMKGVVESRDLPVWKRELFLDALGSANVLSAHREWLSELEKTCFWAWNYFMDYLSSPQDKRDASLAPLYASINAWQVSIGDKDAVLWRIRQILDADLSVRSIHDEKIKNNGYALLVSDMQSEMEFDRKFIRPLSQLQKLESLAGDEEIQNLLKELIEKHVHLGEDNADTRLYAIYLGQAALAIFPSVVHDAKGFKEWINHVSLLEKQNDNPPSKRVARHYASRLVDMFWDYVDDDSEKRRVVRDLVHELNREKTTNETFSDWFSAANGIQITLLVEGKTDVGYLKVAKRFFGSGLNLEIQNGWSRSNVRTTLKQADSGSNPDTILCGLFDFDDAYKDWHEELSDWDVSMGPDQIWACAWKKRIEGRFHRHALLLPIPNVPETKKQAWNDTEGCSLKENSELPIEMLFYGIDVKIDRDTSCFHKTPDGIVKACSKNDLQRKMELIFSEQGRELKDLYRHFEPIFQTLRDIKKEFESAHAASTIDSLDNPEW